MEDQIRETVKESFFNRKVSVKKLEIGKKYFMELEDGDEVKISIEGIEKFGDRFSVKFDFVDDKDREKTDRDNGITVVDLNEKIFRKVKK